MPRPKRIGNGAVVFTTCINVTNQQRNRCTGGFALIDPRQNLNLVCLLALRHVARGAGATTIKFNLNILFAKRQARRAPIDHTADCGAM